ncbi:MAG: nucleotidyltransferase family protein [Polyangiaceae bacterium]
MTRDDVASWAKERSAQETLRHLVAVLGASGIEVLPVKGVVTGHLLYEDPAARPLRDIDVRIRPVDLHRVLDIAQARAWTPRTDSPSLQEAVLDIEGWTVDVECTLGPPGLCATTVERVISRARRVTSTFPHLEPDLHDHALILVLNAFKDGLRTTPWSLEDLRRIVRLEHFDPSVLVSRARDGRVLSALWVVADWLSEQQGEWQWRAVREQVGPRPPSRRVAIVHRQLRARGWPSKPALLVVASSSDEVARAASGLILAVAGIVKRRAVLVRAWRRTRRGAL